MIHMLATLCIKSKLLPCSLRGGVGFQSAPLRSRGREREDFVAEESEARRRQCISSSIEHSHMQILSPRDSFQSLTTLSPPASATPARQRLSLSLFRSHTHLCSPSLAISKFANCAKVARAWWGQRNKGRIRTIERANPWPPFLPVRLYLPSFSLHSYSVCERMDRAATGTSTVQCIIFVVWRARHRQAVRTKLGAFLALMPFLSVFISPWMSEIYDVDRYY